MDCLGRPYIHMTDNIQFLLNEEVSCLWEEMGACGGRKLELRWHWNAKEDSTVYFNSLVLYSRKSMLGSISSKIGFLGKSSV